MALLEGRPFSRTVVRLLVGIAFLYSGAALLMHILGGVSLRMALVGTVLASAVVIAVVWRRIEPELRSQVLAYVKVGTLAGILAVIVYDVVRWTMALVDPTPYDPFEALWTFGLLLVGPEAPEPWIMAAGIGYHALNGVMFGIAYAFLFGRKGIIVGVAWALFLTGFQLALYPGWLGIELVRQFAGISFSGHVAYGATLGYVCKRGLDRLDRKRIYEEEKTDGREIAPG